MLHCSAAFQPKKKVFLDEEDTWTFVGCETFGHLIMAAAALDYRSVLEEKLNAKRSELESTQENLKKYSHHYTHPNQQPGGGNAGNKSVFRNSRLGPAPSAGGKMSGRLGPKVATADKKASADTKTAAAGGGGSILSRVIVEQKSRDEALADQQKTTDKQEKMVK